MTVANNWQKKLKKGLVSSNSEHKFQVDPKSSDRIQSGVVNFNQLFLDDI